MTLFHPDWDSRYEFCHPVNKDDFLTIDDLIDGTPRARRWKPFAMRILHTNGENDKLLKRSDSPWYGDHALIFRKNAATALEPMLSSYGELLPLNCKEADVVMFNITRVLPAIDEKASGAEYWDDGIDGTIRSVKRYVFRPQVITGQDIFKLANRRASPAFVTQRFVDQWRAAGLQGLEFREARNLW